MKVKSVCLFKNLFDIYCAGCGGTRMIVSLLELDFYQAFRYNPYLFVLLSCVLLYGMYCLLFRMLRKRYCVPNIKWLYVILFSATLFMVLRNLPGFEFLLPTDV